MSVATKAKPQRRIAKAPETENFSRSTITLPQELEAAVDRTAGQGKFSAFTQRALLHELQRERIAQWLDEREAARHGEALPREAVAFAERAWRKRK
jgi:post-segregation antitoxin (ccd killing protein)